MSPSLGGSAPSAGPADAACVADAGAACAHEHAWSLVRFELVDDRPVVRQTCETCGIVRGYRAWERYWTPGTAERRR
ncbi:MAG TPA: hypothetical protein VGK16_12360 [Candidatus Limnocylindrales bacterium]|jgi:hypothetical protein